MTSNSSLQTVVDFANCKHWDLTVSSNAQEVFEQIMGILHKTTSYLFFCHTSTLISLSNTATTVIGYLFFLEKKLSEIDVSDLIC